MRFAALIAAFLWAAPAAADLYRWVDPETGSVKFSSYPPPWYGDEARERRAPKVEVIAPRKVPLPGAPTYDPRDAPPKPAGERKPPAEASADTPAKPAAPR